MRRTPRSLTAALAVLVALVLTVTGCSGDDNDEPGGVSSGSPTSKDSVPTKAQVGEVTGKLGKKPTRKVVAEVTGVVDAWVDAAYVAGDYPRKDFKKAFPGFTKGAAKLAGKQPKLMSNAAVGQRVDSVRATKRVVRVDVLAPKGKPAGVTAHLNLVIKLTGDVERTDQVTGRLLLTPHGKRWRVFGFDIARGKAKGR